MGPAGHFAVQGRVALPFARLPLSSFSFARGGARNRLVVALDVVRDLE